MDKPIVRCVFEHPIEVEQIIGGTQAVLGDDDEPEETPFNVDSQLFIEVS